VGHVGQWLTAWITALKDRRESVRLSLPLVAYYWNGASPQAYQVKAVSPAGAYIVTPDRWYMGTVLRLTFQYGSVCNGNGAGTLQAVQAALSLADDPEMTQVVRAKLVRFGPDGIGVRLIYLNRQERLSFKKFLAAAQARGNGWRDQSAPSGVVGGLR
jgi:hypothetical protein